jgi:hypothetical protein
MWWAWVTVWWAAASLWLEQQQLHWMEGMLCTHLGALLLGKHLPIMVAQTYRTGPCPCADVHSPQLMPTALTTR